jgi:hypothetical protein
MNSAPKPDIPFNRAAFSDAEFDYMRRALAGGHVSGDGPFTRAVSEHLKQIVGARRVEKAEAINERRREIWETYHSALGSWTDRVGGTRPVVPSECVQAHHMYYLLLPSLDIRQRLITNPAVERDSRGLPPSAFEPFKDGLTSGRRPSAPGHRGRQQPARPAAVLLRSDLPSTGASYRSRDFTHASPCGNSTPLCL